ncbi:hypothetical protein WG70_07875 [Burkholderia oklahomensis EO147]|nr:hypothetical protein WG70_07875 [Burkholderia oklahomensis EO147]AOI49234.1 hypothetical protein WI23_25950 [Burkholderia oklahomensis C6786]
MKAIDRRAENGDARHARRAPHEPDPGGIRAFHRPPPVRCIDDPRCGTTASSERSRDAESAPFASPPSRARERSIARQFFAGSGGSPAVVASRAQSTNSLS